MSTQSQYIKQMQSKDKNFIKALAHCGVMTMEQAYRDFRINEHRMHQLANSGYLKSLDIKYNVEGQDRQLALLSKAGQSYARNEHNLLQNYRFPVINPRQFSHDLRLMEMHNIIQPDNWKTETMIRNDIKEKLGLEPDAKGIKSIDAMTEMTKERYLELEEKYSEVMTFTNFTGDLPDMVSVGIEFIGDYSPETIQDRMDTASQNFNCIITAQR